ncbi:MAG: acyltransferase family protein [Pseudomonadota bacterium]
MMQAVWTHSAHAIAPPDRPAVTVIRRDIEVLRAVAVLSVLLYHAAPSALPQGFLGVDVFFVVSGFLMTQMILAERVRKTFSFRQFYLRRAARLLPAALTTLTLTTLAAPFLLTPSERSEYVATLFGALTFTANIVLFEASDYFAAASETKPLLHMWSLSLEEQFYLVCPILLILLPRRALLATAAVAAVVSFMFCQVLLSGALPFDVSQKAMASAAFYLAPARAWELLCGALCALVLSRRAPFVMPPLVPVAALFGLLVLFILPAGGHHPGWAAAGAVTATMLICLGRDSWVRSSPPTAAMMAIGRWSYSIYLIHWPLMAYANALTLGHAPPAILLGLALVSIPLGALQHKLIEAPLRPLWRTQPERLTKGLAVSVVGSALLALPLILGPQSSGVSRPPPNTGLASVCAQTSSQWHDHDVCRTRLTPRVALLGDSYAMQWAAPLEQSEAALGGIVQITKSGCAPARAPALAGSSTQGPHALTFNEACLSFVDSAIQYLVTQNEVELVVLSSSWSQLLKARDSGVGGALALGGSQALSAAISGTVMALQGAGKTVAIIAPAPSTGMDLGACQSRLKHHVLTLGAADCTLSARAAEAYQADVITALSRAAQETGAHLIFPSDGLCDPIRCVSAIGDTTIYADRGHLTRQGALLVARRVGLTHQLLAAMLPPLSPAREY